jgi:hypothetical protein
MTTIKDNIKTIWERIDSWMNDGSALISSEKSVVFNFAWQFYLEHKENIVSIDFETSLFDNFSDGQFLDLYIVYKSENKKMKIGIEFKFPNKKESGSGQTQVRQKIINDIKRLNWLVNNDKIDIGCFLCVTNEDAYVRKGNYSVAPTFTTHHGKQFKLNEALPENPSSSEKINAICDIDFNWKYVNSKNNKYFIENKTYSFLNPIFIAKK